MILTSSISFQFSPIEFGDGTRCWFVAIYTLCVCFIREGEEGTMRRGAWSDLPRFMYNIRERPG
jgi:hypothetical protein